MNDATPQWAAFLGFVLYAVLFIMGGIVNGEVLALEEDMVEVRAELVELHHELELYRSPYTAPCRPVYQVSSSRCP